MDVFTKELHYEVGTVEKRGLCAQKVMQNGRIWERKSKHCLLVVNKARVNET